MNSFKNWLLDTNLLNASDLSLASFSDQTEPNANLNQWLEFGGAVASAVNGGIQTTTSSMINDNMPVRSKYSTSDGISKYGSDTRPRKDKNGNETTVDSEWLGKKRTPLSKQARERNSMWIDKERRSIPTRDDRPDIVY